MRYLLEYYVSSSPVTGEIMQYRKSSLPDGAMSEEQTVTPLNRTSLSCELINTDLPYKSEKNISATFGNILGTMIKLPETAVTKKTFRELVVAYEADWKQLTACRNDWMKLMETVIRIDSSIGANAYGLATAASNAYEAQWRKDVLDGLEWPRSIDSALEARLAPLPIGESSRILVENINRISTQMAIHMAKQLAILTERMAIGCIEWFGHNSCQYTFFHRKLSSNEEGEIGWSPIKVSYHRRRAWQEIDVAGATSMAIVAHVHDLIEAVKSHPMNTSIEIPHEQKQILDAVPDWLSRYIEIVEGNLIRERVLTKDLGVETWVLRFDDTVPYHFDPAIVLGGSFVLSGWKPQEVFQQRPGTSIAAFIKRLLNHIS